MQSFILDTREQLEAFWEFVSSNENDIDVVSFDLETDSVVEIKANIYGIGIAFQEEEGFYIPVRAKDGSYFFDEGTAQSSIRRVTKLLKSKKIIGHNVIYDSLVWYHSTGERIYDNIHADTILMKHMIEEEPPFGLKEVAVKYLGPWADKAQETLYANIKANGGTTTKDNLQMFKADTQVLGEYSCWDVMLTYKLYSLFSKDLAEQGLENLFYKEEVMSLYKEVTIPMKEKGIGVDTDLLSSMLAQATKDEAALESQILQDISPLTKEFELELLNTEFPVKRTGNFPKKYASYIGLELNSTAKKVIENLPVDTDEQINFKQWMLSEVAELTGPVYEAQLKMLQDKHDRLTPFNLGSKTHLKWLFFDRLDLDPLSTTETGLPQVDDTFLDSVAKDYTWVTKLRDLNTILKMKSTYIQGILDRQVDGSLYTSFLQFGTTSGRFASRNPNLQNCPAPQNTGSVVDKYVNCVRDSIISRPGYKLIGADFSSLEPHIAAYVSGDPDLIDIFVTGKDFYSAIAVKQFNLTHLSAYKEDENYLGKLDKATRDKTKTYSLAAFYGASGYRIADVLGCDVEEANELLDGYLSAFPGIRNFINKAHFDACNKGYVTTIFGRVRHLPEAKEIFQAYGHSILDSKWARAKGLSDTRKKFKNLLNNAVNFQIQGTAGHVMNRAMLLTKRLFTDNNIDGAVVMTIHDEQIIEVREDQAEQAAALVKLAMESAVTLDPIKLKATPIIGNSYGECK